ncbi:MAG: TetR/AcrR family transcriptional regulator C-terminal domain-containing protein [bacterium]|nr:TetR/AcrR family transcriptional regulator C-terminal domain-containing protein [bacterium]MDY4099401.1 TetR/AcrR family transcriptional regulator C-terminal domain-containing protein [Lachnospiraceae bacterium]
MNKQDPRVIKTLRQIDEAFLNSLKETSFEKITIEMICKKALINRSTFYKYYEDKYVLLSDFLDRTLSEFREYAKVDFVMATPYNIDGEIYQSIFRNLIQHVYSKKDTYLVLWHSNLNRNVWLEMTQIIQKRILETLNSTSVIKPENKIYLDLFATLFASNLMTELEWWLKNDSTITLDDLMRIMTRNMKHGIFKTFREYF